MARIFTASNFHALCDGLGAIDEDLQGIVKMHGYPPMWTRPNTYETLVHIILEQQVSLASALAALKKLQEKTGLITPASVLSLNDEELRACYVSRQKSIYLRSLAQELVNGQVDLNALANMDDDDVRQTLIGLKGIGNWTIDIYLMFVLHRADLFPIGDLAAVNALRRLKHLPRDTPREMIVATAENWRPHRTVATMILWHHYLSSPMRGVMKQNDR